MTNVVYINMTSRKDVLMDEIMFQIYRLRNIVGRREYQNQNEDIREQIDKIDEAIERLEDYINSNIIQEAEDNASK